MDTLNCPSCSYAHRDFSELQRHVQMQHPEHTEENIHDAKLDDYELAQILAFEEAGLPSELALSESRHGDVNGSSKATAMNIESNLPPAKTDEESWVDCFCGEQVLFRELDAHSEMHAQESISLDEEDSSSEIKASPKSGDDDNTFQDITNAFTTAIPKHIRNYDQINPKTPQSTEKRRMFSLQELFLGSPSPTRKSPNQAIAKKDGRSKRLGRAELGPYAHEKQMPGWLRRMLEEGAKVTIINKIGPDGKVIKVKAIANETPDLIPVLARLSSLDPTVHRAYYCSPEIRHVAKMPKEGGFCGYRNIQMIISYIRDAKAAGFQNFQARIPSILELQDLIENAWSMGYNSVGRIETGGIKSTRKYIGTPEAQALFQSLNIPCEASAFTSTDDVEAYESMLHAVCEYFDDGKVSDKVIMTKKPPIYFQHQGHSMTIVGVEIRSVRQAGEVIPAVNLVVFDPMFNPSAGIKRLTDSNSFRCTDPARLLKAHRRGEGYLSKYRDFELLRLK